MKLTRHNGRSGKDGVYSPKHNDRRFDVENSDHVDAERAQRNVYWDCVRGMSTTALRQDPSQADYSFAEIEQMFYNQKYGAHVDAQNRRNERARHPERNRTIEDLLSNNKTCPEETIYQMGTKDESVTPEQLLSVASEFYQEFDRRFGTHVHILDWALHLDESTPHIHERHVFDTVNRYGELCPQQEKALEEMEIPLPNPEKPMGKYNHRKKTFDSICRTMLFDIAARHGLHFDLEPSYAGRAYLEKQDYILMKQREQMVQQEQRLEELTMKIEDVDNLIEEVSEVAYEKAVEIVTADVQALTHQEDLSILAAARAEVTAPENKASRKERAYGLSLLDGVIGKIKKSMQKALDKVKAFLLRPEKKKVATEQIRQQSRPSVLEMLRKKTADQSKTQSVKRQQDLEH